MLCLITIALFIGFVLSLKNSDEGSFKDIHWKDGSTKNTFEIKASTQDVQLQVVDYKNIGDIYEVFDNGISLGRTSTPSSGDDFASSPEEALAKEGFSKGVFDLVAGESHKIIIEAISPYNEGTAAIRLLENKDRLSMQIIKRIEDTDIRKNRKMKYKKRETDDYNDDKWYHEEKNGDWHEEHNKDDCDTEVDSDHTITLYKTTYVDSPTINFDIVTIGVGIDDTTVNIEFNGHDFGGIFESPIAQDTIQDSV